MRVRPPRPFDVFYFRNETKVRFSNFRGVLYCIIIIYENIIKNISKNIFIFVTLWRGTLFAIFGGFKMW